MKQSVLLPFLTCMLLACSNTPTEQKTNHTTSTEITKIETKQVSDYEGHIYPTIQIGDQTWTAENLQTTHFLNGNKIEEAKSTQEWFEHFIEKKPCYKKVGENFIYNGFVISDKRGLVTGNFSVPSVKDYSSLRKKLGKSADKSLASYSWEEMTWDEKTEDLNSILIKGTNRSGFNAKKCKFITATFNNQPIEQQKEFVHESPKPDVAWFWTKTQAKMIGCTGYPGICLQTIMIGNMGSVVCDDPHEGEATYGYGLQIRFIKNDNAGKK